jgi:sugar phosphate isomerase/epimerase
MNGSIYRYMKLGIVHFMAFPSTMGGSGPILETVGRIAEDAYFNAIELTWIKDVEIRKQVKKILDASNMTVAYGAQPRLLSTGKNINDTDEDGRIKAVNDLKEGIDEAYEIGAKGFAFLSGKYNEKTKEGSYKALIRSTKELCRYAEEKGNIKVICEVFDHDIDKKSLIGPASLAKRYAVEIRSEYDNFGLMTDLSHIPLLKETVEEAVLPVKDYIVHAHIGNCVVKSADLPGYGDLHPRFGFPDSENGAKEVGAYLKTLLDIGFLNEKDPPVVSFEVKPFGDESSEIVIANAKRTLNEAWASL